MVQIDPLCAVSQVSLLSIESHFLCHPQQQLLCIFLANLAAVLSCWLVLVGCSSQASPAVDLAKLSS